MSKLPYGFGTALCGIITGVFVMAASDHQSGWFIFGFTLSSAVTGILAAMADGDKHAPLKGKRF